VFSAAVWFLLIVATGGGSFFGGYRPENLIAYLEPWNLISVAILFGLGFGVYKRSRVCSVLLTLYAVLSVLYAIVNTQPGHGAAVAPAFYLFFIFRGTLAVFRYHELQTSVGQTSDAALPKAARAAVTNTFIPPQRWEQIRKRGRNHFIWTRGILLFAVPTVIGWLIVRHYFSSGYNAYEFLGEILVIIPGMAFYGYRFGRQRWHANEEQFIALHPDTPAAQPTPASISESFYEVAWLETQSGSCLPGLWARAFAEADGDESRARAAYIRLRVAQLAHLEQDRHREQSAQQLPSSQTPPSLSPAVANRVSVPRVSVPLVIYGACAMLAIIFWLVWFAARMGMLGVVFLPLTSTPYILWIVHKERQEPERYFKETYADSALLMWLVRVFMMIVVSALSSFVLFFVFFVAFIMLGALFASLVQH
jgi:hypothetical protein